MKGELGWQLTHLRSPKSHLMEQSYIVFQDEEILLAFPWEVWLMLWHSGEVETLGKAVAGVPPGWAPLHPLILL